VDNCYSIEIAGLKRNLPIVKINDKLSIAVFILFSDVELTERCSKALLEKVPSDFDYILTAEAKGIPLAYEMSKQSNKKYIVARKMSKLYMKDPIEIEVQSITTANKQKLFLDSREMEQMRGKRILIVDDVISTGGSLFAMEALVEKAGGIIASKATVLAEGVAIERTDLIYLGELPLFEKQ